MTGDQLVFQSLAGGCGAELLEGDGAMEEAGRLEEPSGRPAPSAGEKPTLPRTCCFLSAEPNTGFFRRLVDLRMRLYLAEP